MTVFGIPANRKLTFVTRTLAAFVLCLIVLTTSAGAAEPESGAQPSQVLQLDERAVGAVIGQHLRYLEDPSGTLTLEQVLSMPERFIQSAVNAPNFSFTRSVYWFHLQVENRDSLQSDWLLDATYPLIDHYTFYTLRAGKLVDTKQGGRAFPFAQRAIKNHNFIYAVEAVPGGITDVYIRVQTSSSLQLPLTLWTPKSFLARDHEEQAMQGLYYGVLIAMLVYNLLIFFSIREISYLNYVHFIGGFILFQMALNGFSYEYLWPDSPRWSMIALPLMIFLALVGMLNFSRTFLDLDTHLPRAGRWTRYFAYLLVLFSVGSLFGPYALAIKLAVVSSLIAALLVFTYGGICLARGVKQARYFMLAWTVLLIGILLYSLKTLGLVPNNTLTEYALQIGSVLEAVLLSFALAHRMTILKEENERIQREATQQLERRVAQRTQELDDALRQLSEANAALHTKNLLDELTGVKNRRFFDEQLTNEIKRSSRAQMALALLMIDIDHFKQVNDAHGHLVGDACLRTVAAVVRDCLRRPEDEVARYGGEEFVVVLPHTDHDGAIQLAETMRAAVEALHFEFEGNRISVTVSIGCATIVPTRGYVCAKLIAAADAALYEAKRSGRNRVVSARASNV